jgi:hypothetical protein
MQVFICNLQKIGVQSPHRHKAEGDAGANPARSNTMEQNQKPIIRVIEIPTDNHDTPESRTVIEINRGQLVVEILGAGNAEGKFKVTGRDASKLNDNLLANNMPAPDGEGWFSIEQYGLALVYAEPVTFGHVILDMYLNT